MPWTFEPDELVAARDEAARDAAEFADSLAFQRLGRAHLWLDEEDAARRSFRAGADDVRLEVIDAGRATHASTWAEYGHLLRMAGDPAGAREAYQRALELAREGHDAHIATQVRYLLGRKPGSDDDGFFADTLRTFATRDRDALMRARDAIVATIRASRSTPMVTGGDLTLHDLLEESFRVEAELTGEPMPGHVEMLARTGLLRDGTAPPPPSIQPPPVGHWTVGTASIEQGEDGPIIARIDSTLCVEFIQSFGEYEVRTYRGEQWINDTGMHPTFGEAVDAATDSLRLEGGEAAVATLTALIAEYGQPH